MLKRILLVLATLAWAVPVSAGVNSGPQSQASRTAKEKCPPAREKAKKPNPGIASPKAVAPSLGIPGEGSIFAIGRGLSVLAP